MGISDSRMKRPRNIRLDRESAQEGTKLRCGPSDFRVHMPVTRMHGSTPGDSFPSVTFVLMPRPSRLPRQNRQYGPPPPMGSPPLSRWGMTEMKEVLDVLEERFHAQFEAIRSKAR